jgi:hypothetical protein
MVFQMGFCTSELGKMVELMLYVDGKGNLDGMDVDCNGNADVAIPDEKTWQAFLRGELALAGCVIEMDEQGHVPTGEHQSCNHRW